MLLAFSAVLSRLLGLVRERVIAHQLGATHQADAYGAAFLIPDILNYFLAGGALAIAFIPLYSSVRARAGDDDAARLFGNVFGTMSAFAIVATVVLWWQAGPLVGIFFAGFDPETQALTVRLVRILLPAQIFFVSGGVLRAVLMARGRFLSQALGPLIYNVGIIAAGGFWGAQFGPEAFAWGALAGAAVGPFAIPLVEVWRDPELRPRVRIAPLDPMVLRYLAMAAPIMFGVSLLTVDEWYDKFFGAGLAEGTVAYLGYGRKLAQVPVGVIGQAIATAALPTLSRLWAAGERQQLDQVLQTTLRTGLGLGILCGAGLFALAHPVVVVIMETGRFDAADSERVAGLVEIFAIAVPAWIVQQIAVRAFYARGEMWFPMLLGTTIALAFIPLYQGLGTDAEGLATAGVIGMSTSALVTLALARLRHGGPELAPLVSSAVRSMAIAGVGAVVGAWVGGWAEAWFGSPLATLACGGAAFAAVCGLGVLLIGDGPLRDALLRAAKRVPGFSK